MPLALEVKAPSLSEQYLQEQHPTRTAKGFTNTNARPQHIVDYYYHHTSPSDNPSDRSSDGRLHKDEAYIYESKIVWCKNDMFLRSFELGQDLPSVGINEPIHIEKALFTSFDTGGPTKATKPLNANLQTRALCVFFSDMLKIYMENGEVHTICVSFEVLEAKPLYKGMIIQRKLADYEKSTNGQFDMFSIANTPITFSLISPTGKFRPISISKPTPPSTPHNSKLSKIKGPSYINRTDLSSQGNSVEKFSDHDCLLKCTIKTPELGAQHIVFYNTKKKIHSVYRYKIELEPEPTFNSNKDLSGNQGKSFDHAPPVTSGVKWDQNISISSSPYHMRDSVGAGGLSIDRRRTTIHGSARRRSNANYNPTTARNDNRLLTMGRMMSHDSPSLNLFQEAYDYLEPDTSEVLVSSPGGQSYLEIFPTKNTDASIFTVSDIFGDTILCIHDGISSILGGFSIRDKKSVFEVPATSAIPIQATRSHPYNDLLYLSKEGKMHLWVGIGSPITIEKIGHIPEGSRLYSNSINKASIHPPKTLKDVSQMELSLTLRPQSQLVRSVLDCLSFCLPHDLYASLRTSFFEKQILSRVLCRSEWLNLKRFWVPDKGEDKSISNLHSAAREALAAFDLPIVYTLHLLYLSMTLDRQTSADDLKRIAELLISLSARSGMQLFWDYYCFNHPDLTSDARLANFDSKSMAANISPPDFLIWMKAASENNENKAIPFPTLEDIQQIFSINGVNPLKRSHGYTSHLNLSVSVFEILLSNENAREAILEKLLDIGLDWEFLKRLSPGLSIIFISMIQNLRENPSKHWSSKIYEFIYRNDIALTVTKKSPHTKHPLENSRLDNDATLQAEISTPETITSMSEAITSAYEGSGTIKQKHDDLTPHELSQMQFRKDLRIEDVARMLRSSAPARLKLPPNQHDGMTEEELDEVYNDYVAMASGRIMALPSGRALFTYSTTDFPRHGRMAIAPLSLSGKFPGMKTPKDIDPAKVLPYQVDWAHFHNGVATALSIDQESVHDIEPSWVLLNRPAIPDPEAFGQEELTDQQLEEFENACTTHAGFLFGVGLLTTTESPISKIKPWQVFGYLTNRHEFTSVALLLSRACSQAGSMDASVAKLLTLHIPALLPAGSSELMLLSNRTWNAAILGIGMLYRGSQHRQMAEVMLHEIVVGGGDYSQIGPGNHLDKGGDIIDIGMASTECHSLASGFALGLIVLGRGTKATELADIHFIESLSSCFLIEGVGSITHDSGGGPSRLGNKQDIQDQPKHLLFNDERLGIMGSDITHLTSQLTTRTFSAPGAIMALGLMYLRTNDQLAISRLSLPETIISLCSVRPFLIMLRTISKCLVELDTAVQPTYDWLYSNLPNSVIEICTYGSLVSDIKCIPNELRRLLETPDPKRKSYLTASDVHEHLSSCKRILFNVIAGGCFGLALAYAGTEDARCRDILLAHMDMFMNESATSTTSYEASLTRSTAAMCLNVVACSLAIVMSGSGDLEVLKRLRMLHGRLNSNGTASYGNHMAWHMSMGLLFLGGGTRFTLSRTNEAIANLVIAFYPQFPKSSSDDQSHLQAWRHIWAMAVQKRCLVVRDADTGKIVPDAVVAIKDSNSIVENLTTPCLMPSLESVDMVSVIEGKQTKEIDDTDSFETTYFPLELDLQSNPQLRDIILQNRVIYVKKAIKNKSSDTSTLYSTTGIYKIIKSKTTDKLSSIDLELSTGNSWLELLKKRVLKSFAVQCSVLPNIVVDLRFIKASVEILMSGRIPWLINSTQNYSSETSVFESTSPSTNYTLNLAIDTWLQIRNETNKRALDPQNQKALASFWNSEFVHDSANTQRLHIILTILGLPTHHEFHVIKDSLKPLLNTSGSLNIEESIAFVGHLLPSLSHELKRLFLESLLTSIKNT
ncbi:Anaphase-promoting complex subunit 1 [Mycoemilia scoparia]|uniref:Anaphase-promoting complex subunit 1 n=1 Tax=Mycoemilia scoparia TaxID=417184 RepID=A0A9W8A6U2_9FUNG|nr:Anaphase-promoting complex subunit 1 [Mycoemilia scoparia]